MKTSIVWFKTDLRLHDNETLTSAINQSDQIIPVYCFDESHYTTTKYGFQKTGNFRATFLLESLKDLDKSLRELGSDLMIVKGKPEIELLKIAKQFNSQFIFSKKEIAYEEKKTEQLVEKELLKINCKLKTFSTSTLYHEENLPFEVKDIPDIFTNFRKRVEKEVNIRASYPKPTWIKSPVITDIKLPSLQDLGLENIVEEKRSVLKFEGGENAALHRLNHYFYETESVSSYKITRNEMLGENYSSKFSAWLALGCLSAKEIFYELKKYEIKFGSNESTYWLVFELLWRDFFYFMMQKYDKKFFLKNGFREEINKNTYNQRMLKKWINAKTGNDFIDANMTELKLTGFMSNRGRQNVASYLCNDLKLDWRYGAAYFEQQLIDYDVCNNWGNWAYLAGVGNDPRTNRYFNTEKQAATYDADKKYRNQWLSTQ